MTNPANLRYRGFEDVLESCYLVAGIDCLILTRFAQNSRPECATEA